MNCDFPGNDLKTVLSPGELCSSKCQQTSGCTHFAWTAYEGGTCWLKTGKICKSNAVYNHEDGSVCGVIQEDCTTDSTLSKGELLWSDEFNYFGSPSSDLWIQENGGHGWGNAELSIIQIKMLLLKMVTLKSKVKKKIWKVS